MWRQLCQLAQGNDFIRCTQGNKQGKNSLTYDFKAKMKLVRKRGRGTFSRLVMPTAQNQAG